MNETLKVLGYFGCFLIVLLLGLFSWQTFVKKTAPDTPTTVQSETSITQTPESMMEQAAQSSENNPILIPKIVVPEIVHSVPTMLSGVLTENQSVSATIKAVDRGNKSLSVTIQGTAITAATDRWTVTLGKGSVIHSLVRKDQDTILKDLAEYQKNIDTLPAIPNGTAPIINTLPPPPFTSETSDFSALAVGQTVTLVVKNIDNDGKTFTATNVDIDGMITPIIITPPK